LPHRAIEVSEPDVILVGDVPLQVIEAPGPRADHVVFFDVIGGVAFTGDLEGRRGARMIPSPADEAAWAASRARLDALEPAIRLGGHPG
jgi:glyoxylase-like metal-dependent hydrolase (beta-lactamase superfamily II)